MVLAFILPVPLVNLTNAWIDETIRFMHQPASVARGFVVWIVKIAQNIPMAVVSVRMAKLG